MVQKGNIEQWAQDIVQKLNNYTEITPSGEGLRVLVNASLPVGGRKRGNTEVYATARYVTLTGNHCAETLFRADRA